MAPFPLLKAAFDDWLEDGALRLSAALAFYSVFSIAPLLVIAIALASVFLGEEAVRGQVQAQLQGYIGPEAAASVEAMIKSSSTPAKSWGGAIVGFGSLLLGASGVFAQLKDALNTIWEVRPNPSAGVFGMIHEKLLNFGMVLVIGFVLLASLLLSTALAALGTCVQDAVAGPAVVGVVLGALASFATVTLLFACIFKVLPDAEIRWRDVWLGAVATALLFESGKWGLSWYLGRESTTSGFGAASSIVILLLWVYYASCILLFGAEFTQVQARASGHEIRPSPGAQRMTARERIAEGLSAGKDLLLVVPPPPSEPPREPPPPVPPPPAGRQWLAVAAVCALAGFLLGRRSKPEAD